MTHEFESRDILRSLTTDRQLAQPHRITFSLTAALAHYDDVPDFDDLSVGYDSLTDLLLEHRVDPERFLEHMIHRVEPAMCDALMVVLNECDA